MTKGTYLFKGFQNVPRRGTTLHVEKLRESEHFISQNSTSWAHNRLSLDWRIANLLVFSWTAGSSPSLRREHLEDQALSLRWTEGQLWICELLPGWIFEHLLSHQRHTSHIWPYLVPGRACFLHWPLSPNLKEQNWYISTSRSSTRHQYWIKLPKYGSLLQRVVVAATLCRVLV